MNGRSLIITFTSLRIIQILLVLITIFLEVVEYASFNQFYKIEGYPHSAYFSATITRSTKDESKVYYNGVKIFSYVVLLISLTDAGIYMRNCSHVGPSKRDIFISAFFKTLWLIYSIVNVYPEFKGYKFNCATSDSPAAVKRECSARATIISFGWLNTILFSATTLIALVLWRRRQRIYEGEKRMRALGDVVYKYQPKPDTIVRINAPEQVMIFDKERSKAKRYANYFPRQADSSVPSQADPSVPVSPEDALYY